MLDFVERTNGESGGNIVVEPEQNDSSGAVYLYHIPYTVKVLEKSKKNEQGNNKGSQQESNEGNQQEGQQEEQQDAEDELSNRIDQDYGEENLTSVRLPIMGSATDENRVYEPLNDVLEDLTPYKPGNMDSSSARKVENITSTVLTAVTNVGIIASVLILAMIGIKYMLGSVEEKAEYKKDLIPYVVGAFVVFGITTFIKIFMLIGKQITNI